MNFETTNNPLWPYDGPEETRTECHTGCNNKPDPYDPIIIDGHIYCDQCASDIIRAKLPGIMSKLVYDLRPINPVFHNAIHTLNNPR